MLGNGWWRRFAVLFLIAMSSGSAQELAAPSETEMRSESDALVDHAKTMLADDAVVFYGDCCRSAIQLTAEELRRSRDHKIYLMLPLHQNPFDVRVRVASSGPIVEYKEVQVSARNDENISLWFTNVHSSAFHRDDYFLSLRIGSFESRAEGQMLQSKLLNWHQNNEYRLVSLRAPLDPSDPAFSVILDDELLVTVATATNPESFIPTVRPTVSLRPADLGVAMSGGRKTRYKVSVGAGYVLSSRPFSGPNSGTQGFLRLQIRFK